MQIPKNDEEMKKLLGDDVLFSLKMLALYLGDHHVGVGDPHEFENLVDTAHWIAGKRCDWDNLDQPPHDTGR